MCDENLDRPHSLWDQHFGTSIDPDDVLSDLDSISTDLIMYRPIVRNKRRYHPFWKSVVRKGRGASTVHANKNKLEVTLDVSQLAPEEINVKVVDKNVIVEAKHDEKEDEYGWVSRQFVRKYIVPSQCDISRVESRLSSDDILTISAARKEPLNTEVLNEKVVKIQYTGNPALTNSEEQVNGTPEPQKDQQPQRGQQHQRARKGTKST
ncbi:Protein lethal(2)essential for life [Dufourea novaeangliae]|uniref:Protein lethal(2)essential for life n=1 Tax=Dufourea novaeangliae TaxID=178035 RepID=A0A154PDM5_DUFNO|nr:Protein lethal(2)essential for life [Dufourea novaeangliae]